MEDTLLCGKMYLPASQLEALYLRRVSPTQQIRLTAVSDSKLKSGGTVCVPASSLVSVDWRARGLIETLGTVGVDNGHAPARHRQVVHRIPLHYRRCSHRRPWPLQLWPRPPQI